jgi:hypothetical protein
MIAIIGLSAKILPAASPLYVHFMLRHFNPFSGSPSPEKLILYSAPLHAGWSVTHSKAGCPLPPARRVGRF